MTKERLRQYQHIAREKAQIEDMLLDLDNAMTAPRVPALDGMPHGKTVQGSLIETLVARRDELVRHYQAKLDELATALLEIETAIETLEPVERQLMRLRYIKGHTWEEICVEMSYSWRQTHRLHAQALAKLA